jgi:competence protein ComEC
VSGQNVAFLAVGVLALAWLLGIPRLAAEVGVLATIAAYTLAVGWQPSVVRAAVAGSLASLAWLTSRQRDRWYFMLVGAAVLLGWNPYSLRDPGFELSFAAVAAIFLLVPPLERWLEGYPVPKRLATAVAVSTACSLVTAPVLWLEFGSVPLYSVPANALAEPAVPPLLALGLLAAVISPVLPGAAAGLAWFNGWLAAYLAAVARAVADLPYARVSSSSALASAVLVCAVTWFALRRASAT